MDNLWSRRSNSSKLSLATGGTNGAPPKNEHPARNYTSGRRGDVSSHSNKNPFNSPATTSIASPTAGASSAFGLGSGAFASFGASKTPKTPGTALDFGSAVTSSAKSSTAEKSHNAVVDMSSKTPLTNSKIVSTIPMHVLRNSWVFWFRPPISKSNGFVNDYEKTLHQIAAVNTVEDFFTIYRHLKRPSTLPHVSDYHFFKHGIRPIWEDEDNKHGGKWIVRLKKGVADRYWEDLLLALIGDQFAEAGDEVCGAVLSVRNGEDILSIWTRNDGGRVLKIKDTMKRMLDLPVSTKFDYKSHDSSLQQRAAADDARKDRASQHNHHNSGNVRSGNKDDDTSLSSEKKQAS